MFKRIALKKEAVPMDAVVATVLITDKFVLFF